VCIVKFNVLGFLWPLCFSYTKIAINAKHLIVKKNYFYKLYNSYLNRFIVTKWSLDIKLILYFHLWILYFVWDYTDRSISYLQHSLFSNHNLNKFNLYARTRTIYYAWPCRAIWEVNMKVFRYTYVACFFTNSCLEPFVSRPSKLLQVVNIASSQIWLFFHDDPTSVTKTKVRGEPVRLIL